MKLKLTLVAATLALAGCESTYEHQGALLGSVAGGILGAQVGSGSGQVLATGVGIAVGAMAGMAIGARMDEVDRMKMDQAYHNSLEYGRSGESTTWNNPDSGNSGSVAPVNTYQNAEGQYCREFQQEITVGGETEQGYGTACRRPDGSWEIMGG